MPPTKVKIERGTAKYYLNLENAFNRICQEIGVDPDAYLENFQSLTTSFDVSQRYAFRCDLHDSWEAVVAKREFKPQGNRRRISSSTRRPNWPPSSSSDAPNF